VVERAAPMLHEAARQIGAELAAPGSLDSAGEIGAWAPASSGSPPVCPS